MAIDAFFISKKTKILLSAAVISSLLGLFVYGAATFAADVTISETITVPLTIGSETVNFSLLGGSLNYFSVSTDKISFSVPQGDKFYITGPSSISFGAATVCSTPGKSKLEVEGTVIITPTKPASTEAEYKNTCDYRVSGGGGSSGGSSGGGGGGSLVTPTATTQTIQVVKKTEEEKKEEVEEEKVKEEDEERIEFADIGKLKAAVQQNILQLAALMIEKNAYGMPKNKKFLPRASTNGGFALQTALTVSGDGCGGTGGYAGASKCKKQAVGEKMVNSKFKLNAKVSRVRYYEILLKALGVKLASASIKELKAVCKDAKGASKKMAKVFMTARSAGIASVYKGKKCGLKSAFPRWQAAQFAMRALAAK